MKWRAKIKGFIGDLQDSSVDFAFEIYHRGINGVYQLVEILMKIPSAIKQPPFSMIDIAYANDNHYH